MEKKNYMLLFLQIAAIGVSGVFGGDTTFALITALIGITFNFLVSMNIAPGFLFGFVYAVCNGILAWQTNVYATFVFMIFMQAPMALYSLLEMAGQEKRDRSDYEENEPQGTDLYDCWRDCVIRGYDRYSVCNKRRVQRKCAV